MAPNSQSSEAPRNSSLLHDANFHTLCPREIPLAGASSETAVGKNDEKRRCSTKQIYRYVSETIADGHIVTVED